jgi:NADPH-dependent 2,4-dienoyl-CoA reductase/sulfur reductase-like enzyme
VRNIVVIGAGAAGMAAATRARRVDPAARVTVLEASSEYARRTCSLPYFVSGEVTRQEQLQGITPEALHQSGIDLRTDSPVEAILPTQRQVRLRGGIHHDYDRLIVSTGSRPRPIPTVSVSAARSPHLWNLRSVEDAQHIQRSLARLQPRRVAVVGGGYLGLEMAEVFSQLGLQVTLFHRQKTVMRLAPACHQAVLDSLRGRRIDLRTEHEVRLIDPCCRERTVEFQEPNGERRAEGFDTVFLAAGVQPEVTLLAAAGARLGRHGGVLVDSRGETTLSGIYAAGDGVELPAQRGGPSRYIPLATNAARLGRVCGENAAGGSLRLPDSQACVAVRLFEQQVASVGHPHDWERAESHTLSFGNPQDPFTRRRAGCATLFCEPRGGRLLGAQFVAPEAAALADLISLALSQGLTLEQLGELDSCYTPPLRGLWHPFYLAAREASRGSNSPVGLATSHRLEGRP